MTATPPVRPRALVVEDEPSLRRVLVGYLNADGFEVDAAPDGESALELARALDPDVVVLDLGLPGVDGVEVCRQLRTFSECYVVMLTARTEEVDKLVGLSVGADDYVTKPFSSRELVARVRAMLRRPRRPQDVSPTSAQPSTQLTFGGLTIDPESREVAVEGEPVQLTRTEFDVLAALARRPTRVMTRTQLLEDLWGDTWVGDDHLIDVHVLHVRQKLGDTAEHQRYIRTVRGVGYRMGTGQPA